VTNPIKIEPITLIVIVFDSLILMGDRYDCCADESATAKTLDEEGGWLILVGKRLLRAEPLTHQRQRKVPDQPSVLR
jgi:hypothetical protein